MARSFTSFAEEKEFYRTEGCNLGGLGWESAQTSVDKDIEPFIRATNLLPFAYAKGMSCSGSYQDHRKMHEVGVEYIIAQERYKDTLPESGTVPIEGFALHNTGLNERYGLGILDPQGYAVIRACTAHPAFPKLQQILCNVPLSLLLPIHAGIREDICDHDCTPNCETFSYQIFLPNRCRGKFPIDTGYMTQLWQDISARVRSIR